MKIEVGKKYVQRNNNIVKITAKDDNFFFGFLQTNDNDLKGMCYAFHESGINTYNSDHSIVKEYKEPFRVEKEFECFINPNRNFNNYDGLHLCDSLLPNNTDGYNKIKVKAKIVLEEFVDDN